MSPRLTAGSFATTRNSAYARFGYGALSLLTPRLAAAALGVKPGEMTPAAKTWAAVFASREAVVGALSLASERYDPPARRNALYLVAAIDVIDILSLAALARRHRQPFLLLMAVPAAALDLVIHLQAVSRAHPSPAAGQR